LLRLRSVAFVCFLFSRLSHFVSNQVVIPKPVYQFQKRKEKKEKKEKRKRSIRWALEAVKVFEKNTIRTK
jgi:hypothetical protein